MSSCYEIKAIPEAVASVFDDKLQKKTVKLCLTVSLTKIGKMVNEHAWPLTGIAVANDRALELNAELLHVMLTLVRRHNLRVYFATI